MPFDLFYVVLGICVIFAILLWAVNFNSIVNIEKSLKKSLNSLKRELKVQGDATFFLKEEYVVFSNKRLKKIWNEYLSSAFGEKGEFHFSDVGEYFSVQTTLKLLVNTSLAAFMPVILFIGSLIINLLTVGYFGYKSELTELILYKSAAIMLLISIISLVASIYFKSLVFRTNILIGEFAKWISLQNGSMPSLNEQIADIRYTLHSYQNEQLEFYAKLTDHIADSTTKIVEPFLENTTSIIEAFVSASTERQVESMGNLAELFVKNTTQLYIDQMDKLSDITAKMVDVQALTTQSLGTVTTIYTESKDCIEKISTVSGKLLERNEAYLVPVNAINESLTQSVLQLEDLVNYIRNNSRNQNFTIENITKFQQDLLDVSDKSTSAMKIFFDEFNDQYSSSIISLRATSADILAAGEILRGSYTEMTENITIDVNKVFLAFEQNLATISIHLSQSINDLQDAIDELPEILKRISLKNEKDIEIT